MENGKVPGYVTEKIAQAFSANTIPIYFGASAVFEHFNEDSFIYVDVNDAEAQTAAVARIIELEQDPVAYEAMLRQPIIKEPVRDTLEKYFSITDEVGGGQLKKRIREMLQIEDDWHTRF
jgi:hypothetical protein